MPGNNVSTSNRNMLITQSIDQPDSHFSSCQIDVTNEFFRCGDQDLFGSLANDKHGISRQVPDLLQHTDGLTLLGGDCKTDQIALIVLAVRKLGHGPSNRPNESASPEARVFRRGQTGQSENKFSSSPPHMGDAGVKSLSIPCEEIHTPQSFKSARDIGQRSNLHFSFDAKGPFNPSHCHGFQLIHNA